MAPRPSPASPPGPAPDPVTALDRIAFLLERDQAPTYRVKAFRTAAAVVAGLTPDELRRRVEQRTLGELKGVGPKTADVIEQAQAGRLPGYLADLESRPSPVPTDG